MSVVLIRGSLGSDLIKWIIRPSRDPHNSDIIIYDYSQQQFVSLCHVYLAEMFRNARKQLLEWESGAEVVSRWNYPHTTASLPCNNNIFWHFTACEMIDQSERWNIALSSRVEPCVECRTDVEEGTCPMSWSADLLGLPTLILFILHHIIATLSSSLFALCCNEWCEWTPGLAGGFSVFCCWWHPHILGHMSPLSPTLNTALRYFPPGEVDIENGKFVKFHH